MTIVTLKKGATCLTPLDDEGEEFCSKPAVTERTLEGLVFPLCAEHAEELDNDSGYVDSTAAAREAVKAAQSRKRRNRN